MSRRYRGPDHKPSTLRSELTTIIASAGHPPDLPAAGDREPTAHERLRDPMYDIIVVGTDGSATATLAVERAAELAARAGAQLHLVSAFRPVPKDRLAGERQGAPADITWMINPKEDVEAILARGREIATEHGSTDVRTHAVDAAPADAILDVAADAKARLIVVGNQGMTGARRYFLGSVPNRISHHADCDVLIVNTGVAAGKAG